MRQFQRQIKLLQTDMLILGLTTVMGLASLELDILNLNVALNLQTGRPHLKT